jgi:hypothetical protein
VTETIGDRTLVIGFYKKIHFEGKGNMLAIAKK